jgi:serine/threonine-protein kinase
MEIIHRDVSLSNVLLSDAGHPMLFDFGVAKATQRMTQTMAGELKGKLPYMAPETFRGAPIDRTVDVFSLGVMLYEMATAISPFARGSDNNSEYCGRSIGTLCGHRDRRQWMHNSC